MRLGKTQGDQRAPATKKIQKQIKQAKLTPRMEDAIQSIMKFMEAVDGKVRKSCRRKTNDDPESRARKAKKLLLDGLEDAPCLPC